MADFYLVTCEDDDGMWFDDPVTGFTADEACACARKKWPTLHHSKALMLYRCSFAYEVETVQTNGDAPRDCAIAEEPGDK